MIVCSQYYGMFLNFMFGKNLLLHDGQASKNEKMLLFNIELLSLYKKMLQLRTDSKSNSQTMLMKLMVTI